MREREPEVALLPERLHAREREGRMYVFRVGSGHRSDEQPYFMVSYQRDTTHAGHMSQYLGPLPCV